MLYWWPKDCIDMMVITRIWFDRKNNLSLNFPDFFLRLIILFSKIFYWKCFLHNRFSCVVGIFHFWERNNGEKCKNFLCCLVLQFYRGIYGSVLQGDIWISFTGGYMDQLSFLSICLRDVFRSLSRGRKFFSFKGGSAFVLS